MNQAFFERIEGGIDERQSRRVGAEIRFQCPSHDDSNPSASWNAGKGVWHCFVCGAGGGAYALARLLGVELPAGEADFSVERLAEATGLPEDFLRSLGLSDGVAGVERRRCVDIPYMNEQGEVTAVRKRLRLTGKPRMIWRRGDKTAPYGLWRLEQARAAGSLIVVEGESDSWTGWYADVPVIGLPGASTWQEAYKRYLLDLPAVTSGASQTRAATRWYHESPPTCPTFWWSRRPLASRT